MADSKLSLDYEINNVIAIVGLEISERLDLTII